MQRIDSSLTSKQRHTSEALKRLSRARADFHQAAASLAAAWPLRTFLHSLIVYSDTDVSSSWLFACHHQCQRRICSLMRFTERAPWMCYCSIS
jgi:hypothetical protein